MTKIDQEYLDELSEKLEPEHVNYLQLKSINKSLPNLRKRIEEQAPDTEDIIAQYTEDQYVEGEVSLDGLTLKFRTLAPVMLDESIQFAEVKSKERFNYSRVLARRRLAYGLMEVNHKKLCNAMLPQNSYYDLMVDPGPEELKKSLFEFGEANYSALEFHGLSDKMSEIMGVWEKIVYDRLNGVEDLGGIVKN